MITQVLEIESMAPGEHPVNGKVVSVVGTLDGKPCRIHITAKSWERIVENADWWRGKRPA